MVTLKDIAQHVGISVSAASMALRDHASIGEETKRKVREAGEALGYRVRSKPSGNIAFVLFDRGFDSPVYARFFQSIGDMAARQEMQPLYLSLDSATFADAKLPPALRKRNVDGIIVSGVYGEAAHRRLSALEIPLVALGNYQLGSAAWAACEVDLAGGIRLMLDSLAKLGHRRIGLLVSTSDRREYGRQIRQIFSNALADRDQVCSGIVYDEDLAPGPGKKSLAGELDSLVRGPQAATALLVEKAHPRIYDACEELGLRIPDDISLISLGKSSFEMRPSLATVESDPTEMGRGAFEKLHRMMENPDERLTREIFPMQLIPGKSMGPVPGRD